VGEDRKEMMKNRSARIEKENKQRSRSTKRGLVRKVKEQKARANKGHKTHEVKSKFHPRKGHEGPDGE
jgi:hypothetical protein